MTQQRDPDEPSVATRISGPVSDFKAFGPSDEALDEAAENIVAAYHQTTDARPRETLQPTYIPEALCCTPSLFVRNRWRSNEIESGCYKFGAASDINVLTR